MSRLLTAQCDPITVMLNIKDLPRYLEWQATPVTLIDVRVNLPKKGSATLRDEMWHYEWEISLGTVLGFGWIVLLITEEGKSLWFHKSECIYRAEEARYRLEAFLALWDKWFL
jgi:hypothetical protein